MSLKTNVLKLLREGPLTAKQLRNKLDVENKKLAKALQLMEAAGEVKQEKGKYSTIGEPLPVIEGRLVKLGRSFGFVAPTDGSGDIFVPGHSLNSAMPGDIVEVTLLKYPKVPGSREGEVVSITKPNDKVVGTVRLLEGELLLIPDNAPNTYLHIRKSADGGVKDGEKAAGQILYRGERHDDILVGIIQRFGSADSARQCCKAIVYAAGMTKSFPDNVKHEAKNLASASVTKDEIKGRLDLREEPIFTIDSSTTKDIDDAISVKANANNGYQLGVHIADVTYYVRPKTALDSEALARGTSVYYGDSVIPMLPKALSNGICSLNPEEDRLAFSCLMELDRNGRLLDYRFVKTVICSKIKGVYSEINALLEGQKSPEMAAIKEKYAPVRDALGTMHELYKKLAALRSARGSIDIESDEPKLDINADGVCVGVDKQSRGDAERMIEEFMLMANGAAAHLARRRGLPFVYRVHEKPSEEKVAQLKRVLTATGINFSFKHDIPTQAELGKLLDETRGTNLEIPVHTAVLRSMAKAKYETLPVGHFGLALQDYAHFTSPIRRYPDLAIHRILSDVVCGEDDDLIRKKYKSFSAYAAEQSTFREGLAQQVERDCDACYRAEYMKPFIGDSFDGVITAVTSFGIYVSLGNTVEGLIHASYLSEHHMELSEGISLKDPLTGKDYRIGNAIRVTVAAVDISQGNIDFVPEGYKLDA